MTRIEVKMERAGDLHDADYFLASKPSSREESSAKCLAKHLYRHNASCALQRSGRSHESASLLTTPITWASMPSNTASWRLARTLFTLYELQGSEDSARLKLEDRPLV